METHRTGKGRKGRGTNTVSVDMQTKKKHFRSVDQSEQLFPRLPDEITFCLIVPKLPWRAFHVLAAVSRAWRQAIQDHRVQDARIHSCSTDTLVVHDHNYRKGDDVLIRDITRIAVYSVRDKLCYNLPPIPGHYRGVPSSRQCISLDGKIYIIGGAVEVCSRGGSSTKHSSKKAYVLDLAGASHWKECASMERKRQGFRCGVIDGKIYVFGGTHKKISAGGAEVYNPKVNAWSPIMPTASLQSDLKVTIRAEKIVVLGGGCDYPLFTEVYHPVEDDWTVENPLGKVNLRESVFVVEGKFHLMTKDGIYVPDEDTDTGIRSWKYIRNSPLPRLAPIGHDGENLILDSIATVVLNDELLAGVEWHDVLDPSIHRSALLQSKGFSTRNDSFTWEVLSKCPGAFGDVICCIQL